MADTKNGSPILSDVAAMKIMNLIKAAAASPVQTFMPVYLKYDLRYSIYMVSFLITVGNIGKFVGPIMFGNLADSTGHTKYVLIFCTVISIMAILSIWFTGASTEVEIPVQFTAFIALIYFIFTSCHASISGLLDLTAYQQEMVYGPIRMYQSLGWGVMSCLGGFLVDAFHTSVIFHLYTDTMLLMLVLTICFILDTPAHIRDGKKKKSKMEKESIVKPLLDPATITPNDIEANETRKLSNMSNRSRMSSMEDPNELHDNATIWEILVHIMQNDRNSKNMINLLLCGVCTSFVEIFLFLYLKDVYNVEARFLGYLILIMTISELPVFIWADELISKFGEERCLIAAHYLYITRVFCYTWVPLNQTWMFSILETSHGVVFGALWCATLHLSKEMVVPKYQGTAMGIIRSTYTALGPLIGGALGGYISQNFGYEVMYTLSGSTMILWTIIYTYWSTLRNHFCEISSEPFFRN